MLKLAPKQGMEQALGPAPEPGLEVREEEGEGDRGEGGG